MAGVQALTAAVRTALTKLRTASLKQAAQLLEEATQALSQTGSQQPELRNAIACHNAAALDIDGVVETIGRVTGTLTGYLDRIGAHDPPDETTSPAGPATAAEPPAAVPDGQRLTREQAESLQAELPPPVITMTGQKTHGRWVDEHGQAHEIVSGNDADAAEAARLLREKGIPQRGDVTTTADVEQKIAARMVREGRKHVDIVQNNRPCRGVFGCDTLLPEILPEGYTLTVHAPNYRKTFTGGK
ncbi:DddA-like double-stranded DNA deaminase toxin [Amycolatopsis sp. NPDC005232]|uniref:DddA-like double-stranded DNA deaminase toxin n=1 Tax=Amycolatopsis sp. NPDC005232 TaxID=3157027 RepID=UPI0033AF2A61